MSNSKIRAAFWNRDRRRCQEEPQAGKTHKETWCRIWDRQRRSTKEWRRCKDSQMMTWEASFHWQTWKQEIQLTMFLLERERNVRAISKTSITKLPCSPLPNRSSSASISSPASTLKISWPRRISGPVKLPWDKRSASPSSSRRSWNGEKWQRVSAKNWTRFSTRASNWPTPT